LTRSCPFVQPGDFWQGFGAGAGLPRLLSKLKQILAQALEKTAGIWPELNRADQWIHRAAQILHNPSALPQAEVEKHFHDLLELRSAQKAQGGSLSEAIEHFLKITRSYWSSLFHGYGVKGPPRTNNDLEHLFGSFRHHQRRGTGQKKAPASLIVRGESRLIAAIASLRPKGIATQMKTFSATDLAQLDWSPWRQKRFELEKL
jgi:hypothetical protein